MNIKNDLSVVILAAGKGTRMKSEKAKVLHEVFGKPMVHHVIEAVQVLMPRRVITILGHQEERVRAALENYEVEIVIQKEQLGTGHAVQMTQAAIPEDHGQVMILCGDSPLISSQSLQKMYEEHCRTRADLTLMTTVLTDPTGYGRIVGSDERIFAIVEEKEANEVQKGIEEINAGIYLVARQFLFEALETVTPENTQGEFYLTDIVEYGVSHGRNVQKTVNAVPMEVLGVNSRVELEAAHRRLQQQRNTVLMQQGVTLHNSDTIRVSTSAEIGLDTVVHNNVDITGECTIGSCCTLESGVSLHNCSIGENVHIGANSVLKNCTVASDSVVPPLTYKRG